MICFNSALDCSIAPLLPSRYSMRSLEERTEEALTQYAAASRERQALKDRNDSLELQLVNAAEMRFEFEPFFPTLVCIICYSFFIFVDFF